MPGSDFRLVFLAARHFGWSQQEPIRTQRERKPTALDLNPRNTPKHRDLCMYIATYLWVLWARIVVGRGRGNVHKFQMFKTKLFLRDTGG